MTESPNGPKMTMPAHTGPDSAAPPKPHRLESVEPGRADPDEGILARAGHLAASVKDGANAAVASVGETMSDFAGSLREHSPDALAAYTESAAVHLEHAGSYLQEGSIGGIADDLTDLVRKHPAAAMLGGVALGFLLARQFRR
jgi:hypothetical protein